MHISKHITILAAIGVLTGAALAQEPQSPAQGTYPRVASGAAITSAVPGTSPRTGGVPAEITDKNDRSWASIGLLQFPHFAHLRRAIKIAIVDDGFDLDNPLWAGHIAHNAAEIPGNGLDDDHNGKTDDYEGWDFGDNDEDVRPDRKLLAKESHGTRVLGVFWQVLQRMTDGDLSGISILPVKAVSDKKMNNYLLEGYRGIEYAIEQKADIILCSWAGPISSEDEKAILARAREKGIMIVAAAGNFYAMQPQYPGAVPSVIDVAATDAAGKKLKVSNYGMFVDISAPGDSLTTFNPYASTPDAYLSATSAAAPVVAAVVTVLRAAWPGLSPDQVERVLKNTATPLETRNLLYAGNLGAGLINIAAIKTFLDGNTGHAAVFTSPKAYIDLLQTGVQQPIRVVPTGRYREIKFLLQPPGLSPGLLPDLRVTVFRDGRQQDTVLLKQRLKYPFLAKADSLYIYRLAGREAGHSPAAAGKGLLTGSRRSPSEGGGSLTIPRAWWYYEVSTIDSSVLYCGGDPVALTDTEGTIEDGSGDQPYTGRNDCKWQITVPAGKKIQLNFEAFDTEPKIDQVYLFNGNSTKDPILAIFSGHTIPPTIKSWGNTMLVWFLTSEENNFQGWKLHYKAVD